MFLLYLAAAVLGLISGLLLKGKLSNILEIKLNGIWLFAGAFLAAFAAQAAGTMQLLPEKWMPVIHGAVFLLLAAGFWLNRHYLGMLVIGAGCALNTLVMVVNGGRMPVNIRCLDSAGIDPRLLETDFKHVLMLKVADTPLGLLADNIYLPGLLGWMMRIVSAGDLLVAAGLYLVMLQVTAGFKTAGIFRRQRAKVEQVRICHSFGTEDDDERSN